MPNLRKEGGAWLRGLRQTAGISQRDLAKAVGVENHGLISQIESGRIRMAPELIAKWAEAVNYPAREFAIHLMKFNEPAIYQIIFPDRSWESEIPAPKSPVDTSPTDNIIASMQDRMDRLEALIAKLQS